MLKSTSQLSFLELPQFYFTRNICATTIGFMTHQLIIADIRECHTNSTELSCELVKEIHSIPRTRRLITTFTRVCNCSVLSQMNSTHPIPLWSVLILSSHVILGFPSGPCFRFCYQNSMHHTCITQPCGLVTVVLFGEDYKLWSSSLTGILQSPVTSFRVGPSILSTCSQTPSVCFFI
jgi:hypothetical protein